MEKLTIIRTLKELRELEDYFSGRDLPTSFDTETNGVDKESHVIGFSVCDDVTHGFYVILCYWDVATQTLVESETKKGAKSFMEVLKYKQLVLQNAPFDCAMVNNNFQVELMPSVIHDTLVGGHLLNENRRNGLKERGLELYGEDAVAEQLEMKASVAANGGVLTKEKYELYKADADLIAKYGAKDAILTLKLFYNDVPELFEQGLDKFFYDDETMPLLRGPTYELNTVGLKVDQAALTKLKGELEAEILEKTSFIHKEIAEPTAKKYPGTSKAKTFNINAGKQLSWLLFEQLGNEFNVLTKGGRAVCEALEIKVPYNASAKRDFIQAITEHKGRVWAEAAYNPKTKKMGRPKKVGNFWDYTTCGKDTLKKYSEKYDWVQSLLEYKKATKLLGTYVEGIQKKTRYGIIRPSFLQHGTTSGRYSSKAPNFQNLPRDDKRVKRCIISRPGKVFVGADYAQLEPRVFASTSGDETLLACFAKGEDFYSVIGAPVFGKTDCTLIKEDKNSFAKKYPKLRDASKIFGLATPYGRTAMQQASAMGMSIEEASDLIDRYFEAYPKVLLMMLDSHEQVKRDGVVYNLFGRPRRIPKAMKIRELYGNTPHGELPYEWRTLLNLAMNHRVQSTGASIMNRAAIAFWKRCRILEKEDPRWAEVKLVLQVHDELVVEGPEALSNAIVRELKYAMENTNTLPGVALVAEPKVANNLADLK